MNTKNIFFTIFCLFFSTLSFSQSKSIIDSLSFYGKLSVHSAVFDNEITLQQNSPRVGVYLDRKLIKNLKVLGGLEYGINIVENNIFNNDANTVIDFANDPFAQNEAFVNRLGFVGFQHEKWGALTVGKQWGVYYDIAGFTDVFTVFGGEATGVYSGNTDGGWKGSGRADNSIVYRNKFKNFHFGVQTQLFNGSQNFGASLMYNFDMGLSLGAAGNIAQINEEFSGFISYERKDNTNFVFSAKYLKKDKFTIAMSYAINQDEFTTAETPKGTEIVAYPTHGFELFANYFATAKLEFQAGFNRIHDIEDDSYFKGEYELMHYVLGANYYITPKTYAYASARLGDSKFVNNVRDFDVFVLGFAYSFDFNTSIN
jgi:predicted porin